jgi:hypothetical protein
MIMLQVLGTSVQNVVAWLIKTPGLRASLLMHISIRKGKTAMIMLKMSETTVQNLVAWATWHLGF